MSKTLHIGLLIASGVSQSCENIYVDPADQHIVDDAFYRLYGRTTQEPRGYFAVVIQISELRCVHLRPRPRTLGPSPTYCYDSTGEFVAVYGRRATGSQ